MTKVKIFDVNNLLWLALALALAGSLKHLAAIFASVDGNHLLGWLQAVAIDTGLFALAYSIRLRKAAHRSVKPLWFGVTIFTVISVYGNLAYGLLETNGHLPVWIVVTKPIVLAASLPILVLFLSELLSDDRQHAVQEAEKAAKKQAKNVTKSPNAAVAGGLPADNGQPVTKSNNGTSDKVTERRQMVLSLLDSGLETGQIAAELDVSTRTIKRDLAAIGTNGNL